MYIECFFSNYQLQILGFKLMKLVESYKHFSVKYNKQYKVNIFLQTGVMGL